MSPAGTPGCPTPLRLQLNTLFKSLLMEKLVQLGVFLLGSGVLIFALTFLHLYLTKIAPQKEPELYVSCTVENMTYVEVRANEKLEGIEITAFPSNKTCSISELEKESSKLCVFNGQQAFVEAKYLTKGRQKTRASRCYQIASFD